MVCPVVPAWRASCCEAAFAIGSISHSELLSANRDYVIARNDRCLIMHRAPGCQGDESAVHEPQKFQRKAALIRDACLRAGIARASIATGRGIAGMQQIGSSRRAHSFKIFPAAMSLVDPASNDF
jgi:hypothetical protein